MKRQHLDQATLALVQIENTGEVFTSLGQASLELFVEEFESRIHCFARECDEVIQLQPNKYCVLLRDVCEPVHIQLAGAKLERVLAPPIKVLDEEFRPCVHAAFVPAKEVAVDTKTRLRIAESGLIEARQKGVPYVVVDSVQESPTIAGQRSRQIELAFERGEFVMYYQPQLHSGYRNVIGAESLMRWLHPKHGLQPPKEFIPFVEQSAVMGPLSWFAIKSAVAQAASWPAELSVAVNISPVLLLDADLIPSVEDALSVFDFAGERLTLEITEDAMIEYPAQTIDVLCRLQALGVRIAIDDFGTGYSSLSNFRELPADELKIDRSFVSHMLDRPRDRDIVQAIVDLAHNLNMKTVAEGVEDNETADALQAMGADVLQGYWFSEPLSSEAFQQFIR